MSIYDKDILELTDKMDENFQKWIKKRKAKREQKREEKKNKKEQIKTKVSNA